MHIVYPKELEQFQEQVFNTLTRSGLRFKTHPQIKGVQPDVIVFHPDRTTTLIEAKLWKPTPETIERAAGQASSYQKLTGATRVFIVLPELKTDQLRQGVVGLNDLLTVLLAQPAEASKPVKKGPATGAKKKATPKPKRTIFAAMPFAADYDDVFFVAMAPAAKDLNATCIRIDKEEFVGDIPSRIRQDIQKSAAVIIDMSGANPNVLYEAGFAHALGKPAVHISSTPLKKLPFDVSHDNTLQYSTGQTYKLKDALFKRLKAVLP